MTWAKKERANNTYKAKERRESKRMKGWQLGGDLLHLFWRLPSHVSMVNSLEKIFASLAPYPFRPPVIYVKQNQRQQSTERIKYMAGKQDEKAETGVLEPCLFLFVIIVGAGEEVAKNQLRDINTLNFVDLHGDSGAVVENSDGVFLWQDVHLEGVHGGIPHLVVRCVY